MSHQSELIANNIDEYLTLHEQKDILRFITCGSVDDGKSTLIGRLLHDSKMIYEDQLAAIEKDSKSVGTTGTQADLALLVDGLQSEREQGITIDVAYRYFSTDKRKFIIADTPGHEQYTRNMATGASSAHLAILLIDARYGIQVQTRRHSYICSLLGIKHFIVAVNKMDLVNYDQSVFNRIETEYREFADRLLAQGAQPLDLHFVPISALTGDNVVSHGDAMSWYKGDSLISILESVEVSKDANTNDLRLPVQYVNRPHLDFRGYCGTLASGIVRTGQVIKVLPSGKTSTVSSVLVGDQSVDAAFPGQAITVTLTDEIDISRGDVLTSANETVTTGNEFAAHVVWMHDNALTPGKLYDFKLGMTYASGVVTDIESQVDVNTLEHSNTDQLALNGIGICRIELTQGVVHDLYTNNRATGSFIVIDRLTNVTVGAGMIARTANELGVREGNTYNIANRAGKCLWLTGEGGPQALSGNTLEQSLGQQGFQICQLNHDNTTELCQDVSDTGERVRRIAEVVKLMVGAGLTVIVDLPPISNDTQQNARDIVGDDIFYNISREDSADDVVKILMQGGLAQRA